MASELILLQQVWLQLSQTRTLTLQSHAQQPSSWIGEARGQVRVELPTPTTQVFNESGHWSGQESHLAFSNTYRWTLLPQALRLEHLRHGEDKPVYLFDLIATDKVLQAAQAHCCGADRYSAVLYLSEQGLHLNWAIMGPHKEVQLLYCYQAN